MVVRVWCSLKFKVMPHIVEEGHRFPEVSWKYTNQRTDPLETHSFPNGLVMNIVKVQLQQVLKFQVRGVWIRNVRRPNRDTENRTRKVIQ